MEMNLSVDLDSLASSIAYATLGTLLQKKRSIPLILTPSNLVNLRPENQLALSLSQVPSSSLLYIDQLPIPPSELAGLGIKFALVDHNSLLSQFHSSETEKHDPVVAIIDHHVDEQKHMSASPRIIQVPTGSTSSLVAMQFAPEWTASLSEDTVPAELATLLLTAGLIDTGGLKAGESSKTTATDRQAGELLWKISGETVQGMFPAASGGATFTEASVSQESLEEGKIPDALQTLTKELLTAKFDVTNLSSRELLMRDYKEYTMSTSLEGKEVQVGLSTVPMGLGPWLSRERDNDEGWEGLLEAIDDWMLERGLDVEGILTTFREAASEDRERGKGRREILLVVRTSKDSVLSQEEAARLFKKLQSEMIAADEVLELKSWPGKKAGATLRKELKDLSLVRGDGSAQVDRWGDVWRQGNTGSTRKQVQPLIVSNGFAVSSDCKY
jgi:exopolyphosphatase